MAQLRERLPDNVAGEFFVDRSCIDCDACRQIAPAVFGRSNAEAQSFVHHQPQTPEEQRRAAMALVACPTSSIGTVHKVDVREGVAAFPEPIVEDISFCGFTSERSFGALSYLIRRSDGNVLVDSPRAASPLLRRIEELGGVAWMFLSHRDDVADHERIQQRFGCRRVLHKDDISHGTRGVELPLSGRDPVPLAEDLLAIPTPGHTRGSAVLLYRRRFLFTGDHLWGTDEGDGLEASRGVCWYSWEEQTRSMERLLDFDFEWVLPGHGRRFVAESPAAMRRELERLVSWMRRRA